MTAKTIFRHFWKSFRAVGWYALGLSQLIVLVVLVGFLSSDPHSFDRTEFLIIYLAMGGVIFALTSSVLMITVLIWRDPHFGWKRVNGVSAVAAMVATLVLLEWDLPNAIFPVWFAILGVLIGIGTLRWVVSGFKEAKNDKISRG